MEEYMIKKDSNKGHGQIQVNNFGILVKQYMQVNIKMVQKLGDGIQIIENKIISNFKQLVVDNIKIRDSRLINGQN
ncbi:unnamed protein product [Paramecium primaurelia]|uniref:Uncharacterized protein n=1 Tax=Paramecium primaurelia TaxID=5886 RepID=A0A8S1QX46_PARPR|nr:unnamed protein product [Paramecium primaurelia]